MGLNGGEVGLGVGLLRALLANLGEEEKSYGWTVANTEETDAPVGARKVLRGEGARGGAGLIDAAVSGVNAGVGGVAGPPKRPIEIARGATEDLETDTSSEGAPSPWRTGTDEEQSDR